ncbi:MAG: NADP-dependent phosphogluconate dehydrogenase [Candidatus Eisenbacteria bacterium]
MASDFGIIGLGVMGSNLARNVERNGFSVAVYNREPETLDAFLGEFGEGHAFTPARTYEAFVAELSRPRRILMMIPAGAPVDSVSATLRPLLEDGDILIDGGNSNFQDTDRRLEELAPSGIRYFGMGVSGGEEGALWGPSLMPGGDEETFAHLEPILTRIAAKVDSGPCVTWCGRRSAGHFVKMVHNGIEYGDMQLIAEAYDLMRNALGMSPDAIAATFAEWNRGELESFLIEITSKIVDFPDDQGGGGILLDQIVDAAGQKGTGKWTTITALQVGVPIPTITAAVDARIASSFRSLRQRVADAHPGSVPAPKELLAALGVEAPQVVGWIREALYASKICSYAQGFDLIHQASKDFDYGTRLDELARIWKGGCIIRARFLDRIREAFRRDSELDNLLLDNRFGEEVRAREASWRRLVRLSLDLGMTAPAMAASLAYYDQLRRKRLPANMIQAQRDFFGAHTYQRLDREGTFHTEWPKLHESE